MEQELEQVVRLIDLKTNQAIMTVCINLTLFFKQGCEKKTRQALLTIFDEYQNMMAGKINFTTNPRTGTWKNLQKKPYPTPNKWLPDLPDESWQFIYHGGLHHRDASDIRFRVLGCAKWQEEMGDLNWVSINFPLTFFADRSESMQDVFLRWINLLQPVHGYADISTTHNHYNDESYAPIEYELAQRFIGLNVTNLITQGIWLKADKIKGISWLTIVDQSILGLIGGIEPLKKIEGIKVWLQGEVYMIQASQAPALETIPNTYYQLGALFEPVRVKEHGEIHRTHKEKPTFTKDNYKLWLARFDKKPTI